MSCEHIYHSDHETVKTHILPCRHKFCIACACDIKGLLSGHVFSCPICGNYSQYVDPHTKVFGVGKPAEHAQIRNQMNHNNPQPPAVDVSLTVDSSSGRRVEDREHHSNGNKMTDEKVRHTISQQQKMLGAIQRENEENSTNHQGVISTRQVVEKLTLSETDKATVEHVLKLRKEFYPEDCPVHEELTNFLCVDCNLKLCAQCGSEHNHSYTSHRIEDMGTLSPRDRNDVGYQETNPGPYTELSSEGKTAKRCHVHHLFFSFYCQECENLLCELCNEEHQRHYGKQPMPLVNMQREVDAKFERHINEINLMKRKFSEATEKATVRIQQLYEQADVLKQKVDIATQQAIDQIRENAEVMIRQIDSETEKVAASHHRQIETANKNIKTLDEAIDLAENALKNSSESEFVVANFAEREIETKMRSLDTSPKHHYSYPESNEIDLECQLNKRLQYSENDGNRSCAPVRLMKSQYVATTLAKADSIWFQRM